ncbi:RNA-guided endonuclease InsQ/TnpB family protein [[Mycobacterium] nativiensis]|uniref:Transposase n=1 Tax=[Mycobacterium] nativiensis TaxID=2855503 RepID=A0ABU5XUR1_9MYCO|nr:zinc ribbon domain-containing protein [Mycolicibacter sp. MYC340]MEB3031729.1 transposase [Mycolicibacter sp. MYC340]
MVKTHDRLVIEDLNTAGMLRNHRLARAIADASWAEFARLLHYKQAWRGGQVTVADRWFASSRLCSTCGDRRTDLTLAERTFTCANGHRLDRDLNAAINLARWGEQNHHRTPDPQARGRATNARRQDGPDQHLRVGETSLDDAGTDVHTAPAA